MLRFPTLALLVMGTTVCCVHGWNCDNFDPACPVLTWSEGNIADRYLVSYTCECTESTGCFGKTSIYKGANLYDNMVTTGVAIENMTTGEVFCVETESHDLCTTAGHAWCVLGADGATQEWQDSSEMDVGDTLCDGEMVTDVSQETDELFLPRSKHVVQEVATLFAVQYPGCDLGWDGAPYSAALRQDALVLLMLEDCPALTLAEITHEFQEVCATSTNTTDTTCTSNECLLNTPFLVADALCPATAAKRAELAEGGGRRRAATDNTTGKHAEVFADLEANMDLLWYQVVGNSSVYDMAMGALGSPKDAWSKFAKRGRVKEAGEGCEHVAGATECGARKDCGVGADGFCERVRRGKGKQKRASYVAKQLQMPQKEEKSKEKSEDKGDGKLGSNTSTPVAGPTANAAPPATKIPAGAAAMTTSAAADSTSAPVAGATNNTTLPDSEIPAGAAAAATWAAATAAAAAAVVLLTV